MTIIERQPHGIIAHRKHFRNGHIRLAAHRDPLLGRMPLHLGRRRTDPQQFRLKAIGAAIGKRTLSVLRSADTRSSSGQAFSCSTINPALAFSLHHLSPVT
jgi:hypothetical protein